MAERFLIADASSDVGSDDWEVVPEQNAEFSDAEQEWSLHEEESPKDNTTPIEVCDIWERESMISCSDGGQIHLNILDQWERQSLISFISCYQDLEDDPDNAIMSQEDLETLKKEERRQLCDVLWYSQPQYMPRDFVAAERKLAKAGILNLQSLLEALQGNLNRKVQKSTKKGLEFGTVGQLRRHLGVRRGGKLLKPRPNTALLEETPYLRSQNRKLCDTLWEARPAWTPEDLLGAEKKLKRIGVDSIEKLRNALNDDLNKDLREAGFRPFHVNTITTLQKRLGAAQEPIGDCQMRQYIISMSQGSPLIDTLQALALQNDLSSKDFAKTDLVTLERILKKVGILTIGDLAEALQSNLNARLHGNGFAALSLDVMNDLRSLLGLPLLALSLR